MGLTDYILRMVEIGGEVYLSVWEDGIPQLFPIRGYTMFLNPGQCKDGAKWILTLQKAGICTYDKSGNGHLYDIDQPDGHIEFDYVHRSALPLIKGFGVTETLLESSHVHSIYGLDPDLLSGNFEGHESRELDHG